MLLRRDVNIRQRADSFRINFDRAQGLIDVANSAYVSKNHTATAQDMHLMAIVFAVGAVDELCKGLFQEVLAGCLLGDLDVPNLPRASVPAGVARLFLDASSVPSVVSAQFEALAMKELESSLERDNFQSYENIATRFSECGLGKIKEVFGSESRREGFRDSLSVLAPIRHVAVHRLGVNYQNGQRVDDYTSVCKIIDSFERHRNNLEQGGLDITDYVLSYVK